MVVIKEYLAIFSIHRYIYPLRCHVILGKIGGRGTMVAMETMGNHSNSEPYISEHWYYQGCATWVVRHQSNEQILCHSHKTIEFWV